MEKETKQMTNVRRSVSLRLLAMLKPINIFSSEKFGNITGGTKSHFMTFFKNYGVITRSLGVNFNMYSHSKITNQVFIPPYLAPSKILLGKNICMEWGARKNILLVYHRPTRRFENNLDCDMVKSNLQG